MARFEATVRVFDLAEPDEPTARRAVEERLQAGGFSRWQVVTLGPQPVPTPVVPVRRRPLNSDASYAGGVLLVLTVTAWAVWFLWILVG